MRDRTWNSEIADYVDVAQAELDLMIYRVISGGEQLVAQSISPVGTVQELSFLLADSGTYGIRVGYSTNLFDFSGTYALQDYGLAWSAQTVPEPAVWALLLTGTGVLLVHSRKKRASGWLAQRDPDK
jgi:hypothetical protein